MFVIAPPPLFLCLPSSFLPSHSLSIYLSLSLFYRCYKWYAARKVLLRKSSLGRRWCLRVGTRCFRVHHTRKCNRMLVRSIRARTLPHPVHSTHERATACPPVLHFKSAFARTRWNVATRAAGSLIVCARINYTIKYTTWRIFLLPPASVGA